MDYTKNDIKKIVKKVAADCFGDKSVLIQVTDPNGSSLSVGDSQAYLPVTPVISGYSLTSVVASVATASSSGAITVQLRRVRSGSPVDMLSTGVTIDQSELDSTTAATPYVIDTANDDVLTTDQILIDIDSAGTGAKGLSVTLTFSA
jgi:hypothetical protein